MGLAAALGFATIGSSIGLMATSAFIIAKAALHPSIAALQVSIVGVRFFGLSRGVFRYLERYVSHQVTFHLLARLRVWFYQAVEPLAPARLVQYHSGDLLSRLVADIESLEHFYTRVIAPPVVAGLVILLTTGLLAAFNWQPALVTLLFLLLVGAGMPLLARRLSRDTGRRQVMARANLNAALVDAIQGAADLLIAGQAEAHHRRVDALSRELARGQEQATRQTALHSALSGLLVNGSTLALLLVAVPLVRQGHLDGVYLAVLVLAALAGFEAVLPLPEAWQHVEHSLSAARRLFEIVDARPAAAPPLAAARSPTPQNFGLEVSNLTFQYNPDEPPVLKNISFSLAPGKRLAIVGASGAGKSTLVSLLVRFWEVQAGEIRLGGHNLRRYRPNDLRQMVGVVWQQTHLFNGTIRDNLLLAHPNASQAELEAAAKQARLHAFIQTLPQGYNTWIGEQGLRLSGGERQRLAIARALLKNPPLLILDEATANLDPLTARQIMHTIYALSGGRTVLIITHRLVGLENVDEILVLHRGRIVEQGTHNNLLQTETRYRRMWEWQRQLG